MLGFLAALSLPGCAAEASDSAEQISPVVDTAEILSPSFEAELSAQLAELEADTLVQLVVVTSPDLKGQPIADYTQDIANDWGVGSAERNDGLVLLVAPNEREVRIAVGLGLELTVTDEEAGAIVDDMLPRFQTGDYEGGIEIGVESLSREVSQDVKPAELKEAA